MNADKRGYSNVNCEDYLTADDAGGSLRPNTAVEVDFRSKTAHLRESALSADNLLLQLPPRRSRLFISVDLRSSASHLPLQLIYGFSAI